MENPGSEKLKDASELTHTETVAGDVGPNDENQELGTRYWLSPMFLGTYMVRDRGES